MQIQALAFSCHGRCPTYQPPATYYLLPPTTYTTTYVLTSPCHGSRLASHDPNPKPYPNPNPRSYLASMTLTLLP